MIVVLALGTNQTGMLDFQNKLLFSCFWTCLLSKHDQAVLSLKQVQGITYYNQKSTLFHSKLLPIYMYLMFSEVLTLFYIICQNSISIKRHSNLVQKHRRRELQQYCWAHIKARIRDFYVLIKLRSLESIAQRPLYFSPFSCETTVNFCGSNSSWKNCPYFRFLNF